MVGRFRAQMRACVPRSGALALPTVTPEPDYFPFGPSQAPSPRRKPEPQTLPNASRMGTVALGPRGEFVSSRPFNAEELVGAWVSHFRRHEFRVSTATVRE